MDRARESAFTLIELLVVIAIIAVLGAILFPIYMTARETGRRSNCAARMVQIDRALKLYASDNGNCMPPGGWAYDYTGPVQGWTGKIKRYLDKAAVPGEGVSGPGQVSKFYRCPTTSKRRAISRDARIDGKPYVWCYSLNWRIIAPWSEGWGPAPGEYSENGGDISIVDNPAKVIELMEVNPATDENTEPLVVDADLTNDGQQDGQVYGNLTAYWLRLPGPHSGFANIVYLDGHHKSIQKWNSAAMTFRPLINQD